MSERRESVVRLRRGVGVDQVEPPLPPPRHRSTPPYGRATVAAVTLSRRFSVDVHGSHVMAYPLEALNSEPHGEFSGLRYQHW